MQLICTDSTLRTFESIQAQDQINQIKRSKQIQQEMMQLSQQQQKLKDSLRNEDDNGGKDGAAADGKGGKAEEKGNGDKANADGDGEDGLAC